MNLFKCRVIGHFTQAAITLGKGHFKCSGHIPPPPTTSILLFNCGGWKRSKIKSRAGARHKFIYHLFSDMRCSTVGSKVASAAAKEALCFTGNRASGNGMIFVCDICLRGYCIAEGKNLLSGVLETEMFHPVSVNITFLLYSLTSWVHRWALTCL